MNCNLLPRTVPRTGGGPGAGAAGAAAAEAHDVDAVLYDEGQRQLMWDTLLGPEVRLRILAEVQSSVGPVDELPPGVAAAYYLRVALCAVRSELLDGDMAQLLVSCSYIVLMLYCDMYNPARRAFGTSGRFVMDEDFHYAWGDQAEMDGRGLGLAYFVGPLARGLPSALGGDIVEDSLYRNEHLQEHNSTCATITVVEGERRLLGRVCGIGYVDWAFERGAACEEMDVSRMSV
tara:strand:- start:246 stop:944 length:699 start_codon:yes stop_codon:yes gene_type:complete